MRTYRVSGTWDEMLNNGDRVSSLPELRDQFSSVQSLSCVWLFVTPWTAAHQTSLFITNSWSLLRLMSIESSMASNQLIFCHPPFLLPSIFPTIRAFPMSQLFVSGGQITGASASASVLSKNIQGWFSRIEWVDLLAVQGTLKCLLQHHSSKASILWQSAFFRVQLSHPYMTTGKTIALTRWTFLGKAMSLLFNMLSRLVITFLPRSKRLLISWLHWPSTVILEPKKIKTDTVFTVSPSVCHEVVGLDAMILVFWMLSVKPTFSVSSNFHREAI